MNQRNQKNSDKSANIGLIRKPDKSKLKDTNDANEYANDANYANIKV